ncbi:Prefoldin subunit-domain-containing protein [Xylariaceae sp. FL0016]|nr:Prefoldin subunit-domain-containing protein [Xylariaceae sp. FL0016]
MALASLTGAEVESRTPSVLAGSDFTNCSYGLESIAYILGALTAGGGTMGFVKTGSIPSIAAGMTVGILYGLGGYRMQSREPYGLELALLASTVLGELQTTYSAYKNTLQQLAQKIGDVEQEAEEHKLVLETLRPLPEGRKCFRMINGVLVERTVKDVIPALNTNAEGLKKVLDDLVKQYKTKQEELEKWKVSHARGHILVESRAVSMMDQSFDKKRGN